MAGDALSIRHGRGLLRLRRTDRLERLFVKSLTFILLALVAGVGVATGFRALRDFNKASADSKVRWLVCTHAHQPALEERAKMYREQVGRWPTNVHELVEARLLPEFSEVHFCPSQFEGTMRTEYQGVAFVDENQTGFVVHAASSPYRFKLEGESRVS
jgi:hypothetical protein